MVQPVGERHPHERKWLATSPPERSREQVGTSISPLRTRVLLLCLDNGHHRFIDQKNHVPV